MRAGNDSLVIYNTTIPGTLTINMGAGNDTLRMRNVHYGVSDPLIHNLEGDSRPLSITLGTGHDLAVLNNVSSSGDLEIHAGAGQDTVRLNSVAAGTVGSGNTLSVDMGPGNFDRLRVTYSTADHAVFNDAGGTKGSLVLGGYDMGPNQFTDETDKGFQTVGVLMFIF
jgi:hypothetical protein